MEGSELINICLSNKKKLCLPGLLKVGNEGGGSLSFTSYFERVQSYLVHCIFSIKTSLGNSPL